MASAFETPTSSTLLGLLQSTPVDEAAWAEFTKRYEPLIYHWCRQWKLQDAEACDVTQDVLLRLVKRMQQFTYNPSQSFRGWLRTLARHAWSDFLEDRRRPDRGSGNGQVLAILKNVAARDDLVQQLEGQYDHELLEQAEERVKQRVKTNTWEAYRLTVKEGLSGPEAARRLGIPVATVYVFKHRVQRMIREAIQQLEKSDPQRPERSR